MNQTISLVVKDVIKETEDAITIVFEAPNIPFAYKSGQFLTLIISIDGKSERRSYSLCSSPHTDYFPAVTVKRLQGGLISNYLVDNTQPGDLIEVLPPLGTFIIEVNPKSKRNVVLIGAGSGITPLISMAKSVLAKEPGSNVFLIYGNRNENSVIFKGQLEQLEQGEKGRFKCLYVYSQPLNKSVLPSGRLNQSSIIKHLESFKGLKFKEADYYICGPHGLMEEAKRSLEILKVPSTKIFKENFVSSTGSEAHGEIIEKGGEITDQVVTVIYQGSEYKFQVSKGKTILEAALEEDIDLPYSCQSGMCTACMGKCTNGKVRLNEPDGLSDKEIQQGFVLTCVGYPASQDIVIEIE